MDLSPPPPRADMAELVIFESKRSGYFADEYSKTSIYWSSLCDLMTDNDGSTQQVLLYIAGKLETDRVYTSSVYANADKVFGDKKGTAKLRHDKIRHAEQKAKSKGETLPPTEDSTTAGGAGRELPSDGPVKAMWEMAEMDCRAARYRDVLCDELEEEELLGKVKSMGKETHKRFKELSDEGDACLLSLRNIDKRVGQSFLHLKEVLGIQLGGANQSEDVWFLECSYRTAVVHQKEAWDAVSNKMKEVLGKMKLLEASRREVLRDFMIAATAAIQDSWGKLPALCAVALDSAKSVDATSAEVERDVSARALMTVEEKKHKSKKAHELPNTTRSKYADPLPSDMSFIDSLTAPLESPLVRCKMMVERRESKPIGSKYHTGLMVLSWDGFIHFFDVPASTGLKKDVSPSAAFQGISPTILLDDLLANKKDLEEVLLFKSTFTLQLDEESTVEAVSSHKSHKLEVSGKMKVTSSFKRHLGSGSKLKTVTFRNTTEAEMNEALLIIKDCINTNGGMLNDDDTSPKVGRPSTGSRSSFGSVRSDQDPVKPVAPTPAPPLADPSPASTPAPAPAAPAEACSADSGAGKAPPAAEPAATTPAPTPAPAATVAATPAEPAAAAAAAVEVPVAKPV